MLKSVNISRKLLRALSWLLPLISKEEGNFEIDSKQYPDEVWEEKKKDLHLLWCNQLIEYSNLTDNDRIFGRVRIEDLKNTGVCIDV